MKLIDRQKSVDQMLNWFSVNEPGFYRLIRKKLSTGLGEDEIQTDWLSRVFSTVEAAVPIYFAAQERKDLMELQVDMARAGRPPINISDYQTPIPIEHQIAFPQVGSGRPMDPETKKWLVVGGLMGVGLIALKIVMPKKAR